MLTHRETQGMVAAEMGACGALTLMCPNTNLIEVLPLFAHGFYNHKNPIDWIKIREFCLTNKNKFREIALKENSFNFFKKHLFLILKIY